MKLKPHIVLLLLATVFCNNAFAQYPSFFQYEDENGLPSNEVYSMAKDKKGFLWFGCDVGLFKFDGVRYIPFKCKAQKSKSISGLTVSKTGRLYCTNFQSQLFYLENDILKELNFPYKSIILHLSCDNSGNLLVNHKDGFAVYNEKNKRWKNHTFFGDKNALTRSTRSVRVNSKNEFCFLTPSGVSLYRKGKFQHALLPKEERKTVLFSSHYTLDWYGNEQWIFPMSGKNNIYKCVNSSIQQVHNKELIKALIGKTITQVKWLKDGKLWICTYNGIIRYNPKLDIATTYYPNYAFSDCLIDDEGNYWFSTLQSGLIRVPNLNYVVWNNFQNNKLIRLTTNSSEIYFATVNGDFGLLNPSTKSLEFLQPGNNTSIQSLVYSKLDRGIYFYTSNNLYFAKAGKTELILQNAAPVKHLAKVKEHYIVCTSFGAFCYDFKTKTQLYRLSEFWSREVKFDERNNCLWVATNNGLLNYGYRNGKWHLKRTLFRDKQILSMAFDERSGQLFLVTFDGEIYSINEKGKPTRLSVLESDCQPYRIQYNNNKIYTATNQGLYIYDLKTKSTSTLNVFSGLASNNVQDVLIVDNNIWVATGKGLQKIPLSEFHHTPRALVSLKQKLKNVELTFNETFTLFPETRTYSSNGHFDYAYRINRSNGWTQVPGAISKIQLQNIPTGNFEIELKAIDHLGRDSQNTIIIKGYSSPPFWYTWWFILLEIVLFLGIVFYIFKRQLAKRQKALNYQNEMNALKLTAIKSQMNPHFIFNVLSSIKGYIYENDRQKATSYLDDFSDLMRAVLEMSEVHYISLAEELKLLKLYIELEAMMLEDFSLEVSIQENIEIKTIQIPSLILQPYIENAFKHGLRHKQGEKKLQIKVSKPTNDQYLIELIDNGIGRKAAEELNLSNTIKRQSFATQALEKRISLINSDYQKQNIELEIVDLYIDGKASGTKIQLTITSKQHD